MRAVEMQLRNTCEGAVSDLANTSATHVRSGDVGQFDTLLAWLVAMVPLWAPRVGAGCLPFRYRRAQAEEADIGEVEDTG
eukprot:11734875-Alexandrium_andersonii.AAC.1